MTGWIILFSVLGLILLLLFSSLKISLYIGEKTVFKISYLFIRIFSFNSDNKNAKQKKKRKKKKEKQNDKKTLTETLKDYAASKHKGELIVEIFDYLKIVLSRFKNLLRHIRFKRAVLRLTVATDDASNTALLYGKICSAVYPIVSVLDAAMKFDPKEISVRTDFTSAQMEFLLSGTVKVRLVHILGFVLSTAFEIIKLKLGDITNGKQS